MIAKKNIFLIFISLVAGVVAGNFLGFYLSSQYEKKAFIAERKAFRELYKTTNPFKHIQELPSSEDIIKEDLRKLENVKAAFAKEAPAYTKGWFRHERNEALHTMRQTRAILLKSQTTMLIFLQQYIKTLKAVKKIVNFLVHVIAISLGVVACSLSIFLLRKGYKAS